MSDEVFDFVNVIKGGVYADLTLGEGGHTEVFLTREAKKVIAVDRDKEALERYREAGSSRNDPRLELWHMPFSKFGKAAEGLLFDGILADLGVSTRQLLTTERGFSFDREGPLDMRMDPSSPRTLASVLETVSVGELTEALEKNTDMPRGKKLATHILGAFHKGQLKTTKDIALLLKGSGPRHPATVLFLALRMLVNEELKEIELGLRGAFERLKPGGRMVVLSFHSTEDRVVKHLFQILAGKCICGEAICLCPREKRATLVTKKPLVASREELSRNPRARSAKLRCVEKI